MIDGDEKKKALASLSSEGFVQRELGLGQQVSALLPSRPWQEGPAIRAEKHIPQLPSTPKAVVLPIDHQTIVT